MKSRVIFVYLLLAGLVLPLFFTFYSVSAYSDNEKGHDLDDIHHAVKSGEIKPLGELLNQVREQFNGEVIEIEIEREFGVWVYEFELISSSGRLLEIYVNASTGEILRVDNEE